MTITQQVVPISFQDPAGNPLAGGLVTFDLQQDIATGIANGPQVSAGRDVSVTLDSNGSAIVLLWPNDTLLPAGSVYFVTAFTALGQPVWKGELTVGSGPGSNYILLEDGSLILIETGGPLDGLLMET